MIKLIVGLGNPAQYSKTRHNVGMQLLDFLSDNFKISTQPLGHIATFDSILLYKPKSYMNICGPLVKSALTHFKISPENLLIVADNIDLAFGKLKVKQSGSPEGHHGVESIIKSLQTKSIKRLYIGVDRPSSQDDVPDYVLSNFTKSQ